MSDEIDPYDLSDDQSDEITAIAEAEAAANRCPACRGQKGEDFTCSICDDTGFMPPDSPFRLDSLALATQAGWDYAGAPKGFKSMYSFVDISDEATAFWEACDYRSRRVQRIGDALFGPETEGADQ